MIIKYVFDRVVAAIGLLFLWPVLLIVAILVKIKCREALRSLSKREWVREASYLIATSSVR